MILRPELLFISYLSAMTTEATPAVDQNSLFFILRLLKIRATCSSTEDAMNQLTDLCDHAQNYLLRQGFNLDTVLTDACEPLFPRTTEEWVDRMNKSRAFFAKAQESIEWAKRVFKEGDIVVLRSTGERFTIKSMKYLETDLRILCTAPNSEGVLAEESFWPHQLISINEPYFSSLLEDYLTDDEDTEDSQIGATSESALSVTLKAEDLPESMKGQDPDAIAGNVMFLLGSLMGSVMRKDKPLHNHQVASALAPISSLVLRQYSTIQWVVGLRATGQGFVDTADNHKLYSLEQIQDILQKSL